jgi:hypothetical protein
MQVKKFTDEGEVLEELEEEGLVLPVASTPTPLQAAAPTLIMCGMFFSTVIALTWMIINAFTS